MIEEYQKPVPQRPVRLKPVPAVKMMKMMMMLAATGLNNCIVQWGIWCGLVVRQGEGIPHFQ